MKKYERFEGKDAPNSYEFSIADDCEAWISVLYACMYADGKVGDSELSALSRILVYKERFQNIDFGPIYQRVKEATEKLGASEMVKRSAQFLDLDDGPTLFTLAVEVVLADGQMTNEEFQIIQEIATYLEIEMDLVDQITQVMLIRNKGNILIND